MYSHPLLINSGSGLPVLTSAQRELTGYRSLLKELTWNP